MPLRNKKSHSSTLQDNILKLIALTLLLLSTSANAHLLKVFAYTQMSGDVQHMTTSGKVYFAGGAAIPNLKLEVVDSQGNIKETLKSDPEGKFSITLTRGSYHLQANTQDGHIAKWPIKPPKINVPKTVNQQVTNGGIQGGEIKSLTVIDQTQMQQILAEIVSSQVQPLSEQVNALQERTKVQDIIGALGYIFGLYGLAMWWRHRKLEPVKDQQPN